MKSGSGLLGRNAENAVTANIVGTERDRAASPRTDGNENGLNAQSAPVGFALPRDLNPSRSTSTLFSVVMPITNSFSKSLGSGRAGARTLPRWFPSSVQAFPLAPAVPMTAFPTIPAIPAIPAFSALISTAKAVPMATVLRNCEPEDCRSMDLS
jgi:hypothetical protein